MPVQKKMNPYFDVFEQMFDDASFLWILRSVAQRQPHYLASEVADLEKRIDNHLNGLFVSPDDVWGICQDSLSLEEPGEVFTSAVIAFKSLEANKIQEVVSAGLNNDRAFAGLVSALGWIPKALRDPWLLKFLRSKDLSHKYLAVEVYSHLRQDPGDYLVTILSREDCISHEKLYASCLRLVGELKRRDLVTALNSAMDMENEKISFWALWSAIFLGNLAILKDFELFVLKDGPFRETAMILFFRVAPITYAKQVISDLAKSPENTRLAIKSAAILGDPQVVPWLIGKMNQPEYARVAGEAFSQITGINLEEHKLDLDIPEHASIPNDDNVDEDVDMDEDENLPWPNVDKLKAVWHRNGGQYAPGQRLFLGEKFSMPFLKQQIATGHQRWRWAASIELALIDGSAPLFNIDSKIPR